MKLIAYYALYNEVEYIEYSLRSIYDYVDQIIIIEGAWKETYLTNGEKRSNDGTIEKIQGFPDPQNKITIHYDNEDNQLAQRNKIFGYLPNEDCWMLLIDGDEVYDPAEIVKIKELTKVNDLTKAFRFKSLIFINDFYHYCEVEYFRLFKIEKQLDCAGRSLAKYIFTAPNDISKNGEALESWSKNRPDIAFHHYSYCKSNHRFQEKKRERTKLHGQFAWELRNGLVQRDDADIKDFTGEHPEIMKDHPRYNQRVHVQVTAPETIVYVEHSGIGNMVLSTPLLKALRQLKPNAQICVHTWDRSVRALEGADFVDVISTKHPQLLINSIKRKIDHVLVSPVGAMKEVVQIFANYAHKTYSINIGPFYGKHEAEYKLDLARYLGYKGPLPPCEFPIFEDNLFNANAAWDANGLMHTPFFCINASFLKSDHWNAKHWGDTQYTKLLIELHKIYPDHMFVFVGSKDDEGDADRISANMEPTRSMDKEHRPIEECLGEVPEKLIRNSCGKFNDIKDSAAFISKSVLVIGNDGGLQHIAAAMGVPTLTIFTFTNPIKNRPLSSNSHVVLNPCNDRIKCQHLPWNTFRRNEYGEYEDSPCYKNDCLKVSVEKVVAKIKEVYNGGSRTK